MYYNIFYDRKSKTVHLFDDKKGYKKFQYQPTCYIKSNTPTILKSIYGDCVTEISNNEFLSNKDTFERDIITETKLLVDLYYHSDEPSIKNDIYFIDIETDSKSGFPNLKTFDKEIISIAFRHYGIHTYVFIVDNFTKFTTVNSNDATFFTFKDEYSMLKTLVNFIRTQHPTILSGWNSEHFDIPYLLGRGKKILGSELNKLSPIGIIDIYEKDDFKKIRIGGISHLDFMTLYKKFTPTTKDSYSLNNISLSELKESKTQYQGKLYELYENNINEFIKYNIHDVMLLEKLEDKLHYIRTAISICHKGHIPYEDVYMTSRIIDGALLVYMRKNNLVAPNKPENKTITTNRITYGKIIDWTSIKDKVIVKEVDKDREYTINIDLVPDEFIFEIINDENQIKKYTKLEFQDFITEHNTKISSIGRVYLLSNTIRGAYVKEPLSGKYSWIIDLDYTSLYPSIIRTLNISPETKLGKIEKWESIREEFFEYKQNQNSDFSKKELNFILKNQYQTLTFEKFLQFCQKYSVTIASNGIIYNSKSRGIIPNVLDIWFKERVEFKKSYKKYLTLANEIKIKTPNTYEHNIKYKEYSLKASEYDVKQIVTKILSNSTYGALLLNSFRFYDRDNGEAVTITGQYIIKNTEKKINQILNNKLHTNTDFVITVDTDSTFINVDSFVKEKEDAKKLANELQLCINVWLNDYSKHIFNVSNHFFEIKQELTANGAIFLGKKKYALWVLEKEGVPINDLEVKGIDIVRSNFPKYFREELRNIVLMILQKDSSNTEINNKVQQLKLDMQKCNLIDIAIPTGIKNVDKYVDSKTRYKKGAPVYSKAAINHNILLERLKLTKTFQKIKDNQKIKYVFLKENVDTFDTMAFIEDSPKEILDYAQQYIDYERIFNSVMTKKLEKFYKVLDWKL